MSNCACYFRISLVLSLSKTWGKQQTHKTDHGQIRHENRDFFQGWMICVFVDWVTTIAYRNHENSILQFPLISIWNMIQQVKIAKLNLPFLIDLALGVILSVIVFLLILILNISWTESLSFLHFFKLFSRGSWETSQSRHALLLTELCLFCCNAYVAKPFSPRELL